MLLDLDLSFDKLIVSFLDFLLFLGQFGLRIYRIIRLEDLGEREHVRDCDIELHPFILVIFIVIRVNEVSR